MTETGRFGRPVFRSVIMQKRRLLHKAHAGRAYLPLLALLLLLGIGPPAMAGEAASTQSELTTTAESPQFRAGYENVPQFGGPTSVGGALREDDEAKETEYVPPPPR